MPHPPFSLLSAMHVTLGAKGVSEGGTPTAVEQNKSHTVGKAYVSTFQKW